MTIGTGLLTGQCWTAGWTEKLSGHFEFTFLRLMEGGGVGANYSSKFLEPYGVPRRKLDIHIVCDPDHPDYAAMRQAGLLSNDYNPDWDGAFEVSDSREGWAEALTDLIDTYMTDNEVHHKNRVYDVSRVRSSGSRLKTFGGTASGPQPFASMMLKIGSVLNGSVKRSALVRAAGENAIYTIGGKRHLTPLEAMEIDHAIAECVVSGGNRRSARMSILPWDDPHILSFINCKADTGDHWTTNISVEIDDDFLGQLASDNSFAETVHKTVVAGMLANGEPGYWNSSLSNKGELEPVYATNPCLTGDTVIATLDGPRTLKELAEDGNDVEVYSWHPKTKTPVVRWMRNPRLTRKNVPVMAITFDSGLVVRATPDHSFYTFRGEKVEAQNLRVGQSIRAFSASRDGSGHERIHGWDSKRRVVSIERDGRADVYNGTVDDSHTYIVLDPEPVAGHMSGIVSANCGEITLQQFEACNLGHINLDAFAPKVAGDPADLDGMVRAHELMTRFLMRATYADINDPRSRAVQDKNRRIGVGHFGVQGYITKSGVRYSAASTNETFWDLLRYLYRTVREQARRYAFELRIPEPVKVTTVAPTGSIAKLPGVTEGIHPIYAKFFERRIRFSLVDPDQRKTVFGATDDGFLVETDQYDKSGNTAIVVYPTKDQLVAEVEAMGLDPDIVEDASELDLSEMLAFQATYQECWADNAVSFTANVSPDLDRVAAMEVIKSRLPDLKGTTIMPDNSRPQSPYTRITEAEYEEAEAKRIEDAIDLECASGACPIR